MWFYVDRILVGYQVADAVAHQRPRGNLSDLYPRWLGARELLLHGRNPYSDEIAIEIQKGYYGRALDPNRPYDPKDQQGFAYPVYVVFLLAPLIGLPFHTVQIFFHWFLLVATAASVLLWLFVLRWRLPALAIASAVVLTLGSFPAVQGVKLQQLSLLVAALMAGAAACVSAGCLFCGGAFLALATIKPQLAWPLVGWFLVWAASDWRTRWRFVFGFGLVMTLLLAGANIILPNWLRLFAEAIGKYHRYTQNQSVLDQLMPWGITGKIVAGLAAIGCAWFLWGVRRKAALTAEFGNATALVMALTVLIVPMYAPYNQVLLLPAVFVTARDYNKFWSISRAKRFAAFAGGVALCWQWIVCCGLTAVYWVSPVSAISLWKWPLAATFALPVLGFGLIAFGIRSLNVSNSERIPELEGNRPA